MDSSSSIVASCIALRDHISLLLSDVQRVNEGTNHTNHGLRHLPGELASLHLTVGAIQSSCSRVLSIPITLRANLRSVITSCAVVVNEMRKALAREPGSVFGGTSLDMMRLLPSLEAHKSAIQIALELILVTTTEESSNSQVPHSEPGQNSDQINSTDQIFGMLRQIRILQLQLTQLAQARESSGTSLHRFLDDVSEYAESVYPASDGASMRAEVAREDDLESDSDDFHSARESFSDSARPSSQIDLQSTENSGVMPTNTTDNLQLPTLATTLSPVNIQGVPVRPVSTFSGTSTWYSIRLRITNRFYNFRAASDTTRNMLSAIAFLDPAVRAVRLARQQGVLPLSEGEKVRIDRQILFAEQSMEQAASLVEPARIELQKRAKVGFARKVKFVLRDSPRIQACFEQLSAAGAGLNEAANVLYGTHMMGDTESMGSSSRNIPAPPYSLSLRGEY